MSLEKIGVGQNVPHDVYVVIEIASHSHPIKYELDKASGRVMVDRFLATSMFYPCEYGFIPHTLSEDGDPADVLVISPYPLMPGVIIHCRPIGLLRMTDESGKDAKILAVPVNKLTTGYESVARPEDLGGEWLHRIEHFFKHYKDLEKGKWSKIDGWEGIEAAHQEILACIKRHEEKTGRNP